ncbi:hypothetical protein [Alkalibacillus salilacus]|nr:hypothetical protein [Alkalibacillus salilacus]
MRRREVTMMFIWAMSIWVLVLGMLIIQEKFMKKSYRQTTKNLIANSGFTVVMFVGTIDLLLTRGLTWEALVIGLGMIVGIIMTVMSWRKYRADR